LKLVIAILDDDDAEPVLRRLVTAGYSATRIASTGGFLASGNSTILTGCDDHEVDSAVAIVSSRPGSDAAGVGDGRGVVFVVPVDRYLHL
jgi:uncharacterized protein YaaQ